MAKIVITGAAGTLGAAVARMFAKRGAQLALLDRATIPTELRLELGDSHLFIDGVDLVDVSDAGAAMETANKKLGGIDSLLNVAGGFRWQTLAQGDIATWQLLFDMNLSTAIVASKAALPFLLASQAGSIVNVGAGAASRATAGMGPYAAAKSGVLRLTEALADELKNHRVTVNAVVPGVIDTPENRLNMPEADPSRWVQPEDIANCIAFLASAEARAVTGAALLVQGRG